MPDGIIAIIEMVFSFGIVLAVGAWELRSLARAKREREQRDRDGQDPAG